MKHYFKVPPEEYYLACEESKKNCGSYKEVNDKDLYFNERNIPRNDLDLIKVVEEMKGLSNAKMAKLDVVEIPDNIEWEISEYDGYETVEEKHRSW